jgi:hypothetical protein
LKFGESTLSILDVKDRKIQSWLRGLLDKQITPASGTKLIDKIYGKVTLDDIDPVVSLLFSNKIYSHLALSSNPAPKSIFKSFLDSVEFHSPEVTLRVLQLRLNMSHDVIKDTFIAFAKLNEMIFSLQPENIVQQANIIRDTYGDSFLLFRKLAAAQSLLSALEVDSSIIEEEINSYDLSNRNPSAILTADTIGWQYDLLSLRKKVLPSTSIQANAPQWKRIADWLIYPIRQSPRQFHSALQTHWQISLTDAMYIYMIQVNSGQFITEVAIQPLNLSSEIRESWKQFETSAIPASGILDDEEIHRDFLIFRTAPAFLENSNIFKLRALGDFYTQKIEGTRLSALSIGGLCEQAFFNLNSYSDLAADDFKVRWPESSTDFDSGIFVKSMAFLHLCSRAVEIDTTPPENFIKLMGDTRDLPKLVPQQELRDLLLTAVNPLTQLIILLLLMLERPSTVDSFKFRSKFQTVILNQFDGSIVEFLEYINKLAPDASLAIISVLDENTLSQMPRLLQAAEDVYKTRADILEWYGFSHKDESSIERAKQLRLDRKLQKIRGQIDSARLSVDSQRFSDWFEDNHLQKFGAAVRDEKLVLPDFTAFKATSSASIQAVIAHRDPGQSFISELVTVFDVFCVDNNFGVSSYLGRRIRHGTVRGTLNAALDEFEISKEGKNLLQNEITAETYYEWRNQYHQKVSDVEKQLYFRTKDHSDGMISTAIDSPFNFAILHSAFSALKTQFREDGHFLMFPPLVENYCWLLLSPELENLQQKISTWRMDWAVIKLKTNKVAQLSEADLQHNALAREVNLKTDQAFKVFISWFQKPSSLIPEATLSEIIDVAIIEANDEFANFNPTAKRDQLCDVTLTGAVYYHVYDALSIIVKNAAKHGAPSGDLLLFAEVLENQGAEILRVKVSSSLNIGADATNVREEIEYRRGLPEASADTFQGKSGIRKLQKLKNQSKLMRWNYNVSESTLLIELEFHLSGLLRA